MTAKAEILLMGPLLPGPLAMLDAQHVVHRWRDAPDRQALLERVTPTIRAIATTAGTGGVDAALIDRCPKLEIIANNGVGYDGVDAVHAGKRGVIVTNTPDVLTEEVADLTIGLLVATVRRLPQADRYVREGRWLQAPFPLSPTLRGKRVGIAGLGRIGKAIARRVAAFGLDIAYYGRSRQADVAYPYYASLVELARDSDILIVVTPGGAETKNLVDRAVLDALGPDGTLINVARGTVVDEPALVAALAEGRLGAAGLDVFAHEPKVPEALFAMENVVLLPHAGSASIHTRNAMSQLTVDNLLSWFAGKGPLTPVTETPWRP